MADDFDLLLEDPSVLAALDNIERQHCRGGQSHQGHSNAAAGPAGGPQTCGSNEQGWGFQGQQPPQQPRPQQQHGATHSHPSQNPRLMHSQHHPQQNQQQHHPQQQQQQQQQNQQHHPQQNQQQHPQQQQNQQHHSQQQQNQQHPQQNQQQHPQQQQQHPQQQQNQQHHPQQQQNQQQQQNPQQNPQHPQQQQQQQRNASNSQPDRRMLHLQQTAPGHAPKQSSNSSSVPSASSSQHKASQQARQGPTVTISTVLAGEARLGFRIPYNETLQSIIKRIQGNDFDRCRKLWVVPMARKEEATAALCACPTLNVKVEPLPPIVSSVTEACSKQADDSELYARIPEPMEKKLMEFQRHGIKFGLSKGGRVLLGDEMGLGKTVQAVALLACYKDEWPCLIITPSSLREQWADAIFRWLGIGGNDVHIIYEKRDADIAKRKFQFLIISYDYVPKIKQELERRAFKVIVCDESHYIKNHKAVRTKETVPLLRAARRCILCSGTPALSRPIEILQQMMALVPKAKVTVNSFADRYCQGSNWSKLSGASNLEELHALCTSTFMKRRLKKDVLDQLPPKMRQQLYLQLNDKDMAPLKPVVKQLEDIKVVLKQYQQAGSDVASVKNEEKRLLNEFYIKSAEAKVRAVQEYVSDLLENDEKFLIFAHHKALLDGVEQRLRNKKVRFIRIDGSTAAHERQGLVTSFQEDERVKVAVLSLRAAGVGLTLTAAHLVVMAELSWTPGELLQAEDRAHRIGQADCVAVHYLHARSTIDDIIWQTIQNKLENVGQTLDGSYDRLEVEGSSTAKQGSSSRAGSGSGSGGNAGKAGGKQSILGLLQQQQKKNDQKHQQGNSGGGNGTGSHAAPPDSSSTGAGTHHCPPPQQQQQQQKQHSIPQQPPSSDHSGPQGSEASPAPRPQQPGGARVIDLTGAEEDFCTAAPPAPKRPRPC